MGIHSGRFIMAAYYNFLECESTPLGIKTKASLQGVGAQPIRIKELSKIANGDHFFIVGHGSQTSLAKYSPSALAKHLTDNGLSQPVNIFLYSCSTGFGGAPYALELKMQLVQQKILCTVQAPTGPINSAFSVKTSSKSATYGTGRLPTTKKPSWVH